MLDMLYYGLKSLTLEGYFENTNVTTALRFIYTVM